MKLIIRADDYGVTNGVTAGILEGFRDGVVTCTGFMTNLSSSPYAAQMMREYSFASFGEDVNLCAGRPVSDPSDIPHMVDENGIFLSSHQKHAALQKGIEPLPYHEVRLEVENQLKRFIELTGRKPAYLNGHAFRSPNFSRALEEVASQYEVPCMDSVIKEYDLKGFEGSWYKMPMDSSQIELDPESYFIDHFEELLSRDISFVVCHPGYVDWDLMNISSFNTVRMRDLQMVTSKKIRRLIEQYHVELISVQDLLQL